MVAIIGVYPLPVRIAGRELLFSTMGNVGTLPEYRGKGYMKALLAEAMDELTRLDVDATRLGGMRQRYNRFGFDHAGQDIHFSLNRKNIADFWGNEPGKLSFRPLKENDSEGIAYARSLHRKQGIYTVRETDKDFFLTLCAWGNVPCLALNETGSPIGYLSGTPDGTSVAEQGAENAEMMSLMMREWLLQHSADRLTFRISPWETEEIAEMSRYCENWYIQDNSMFRIAHWERVTEALLALAMTIRELPDGKTKIGINGTGTLTMEIRNGIPHCAMTEEAPELTVDSLSATRLLFGPIPAYAWTLPKRSVLGKWLPLPLAWNGQDRV